MIKTRVCDSALTDLVGVHASQLPCWYDELLQSGLPPRAVLLREQQLVLAQAQALDVDEEEALVRAPVGDIREGGMTFAKCSLGGGRVAGVG